MITILLNLQVPLKVLPLHFRWRCGAFMPFEMGGYVQSAMLQGTVYVGGGDAHRRNSKKHNIVMAYHIGLEKWAELPPYRAHHFAMTVINNELLLAGGWESDRSKVVGVWRPDSKKWTHPYPDMSTPRLGCSAVAFKEWLVVAGGVGDGGADLYSVEVLNTDTKQWSAGPPTPAPWSYMKTAIVGETCYFMGGHIDGVSTTRVYSVSLPAIPSKHFDFKEISQLPTHQFTPLSIRGSLLTVGGKSRGRYVSEIHLYQPDSGKWVKVGDLLTPRCDCVCTMLTDGELLVAGGSAGGILRSVDIAHVDS